MKRVSDGTFDKVGRDAYYTSDPKAHVALCQWLPKNEFTYVEPCAGAGNLIKGISTILPNSKCVDAIDVDPAKINVSEIEITHDDALSLNWEQSDYVITNPPFSKAYKQICFQIIDKSITHADRGAWMLLPLGWTCNKDFQQFMQFCEMVVPIGRVKWFENSDSQESSDSVWMKFTKIKGPTTFQIRNN